MAGERFGYVYVVQDPRRELGADPVLITADYEHAARRVARLNAVIGARDSWLLRLGFVAWFDEWPVVL